MTISPDSTPTPSADYSYGMPYRHYKGGAYSIVGEGRLEADLAPVVVYRAMRDPAMLWVRTREVFEETVPTAGGVAPRFAPDWPAALGCLDFLGRQTVLAVLSLHDAPYRHYHDRRHVLEMFEVAHRRGIGLTPAQALAVLFHDAVYVPGCEHNEVASAALVGTMASHAPAAVRAQAARIVLDTRSHEATDADAATVLDLDLWRLAGESGQFDAWTEAVFAENAGLLRSRLTGDEANLGEDRIRAHFIAARAAILQRLAMRPRLFLTAAFADCEAPARANIARLAAIAGRS